MKRRLLARSLWGSGKGVWIDEGLAVYSDDQWRGSPLHEVAKWLLDHQELISIRKLFSDGWPTKYPDMTTYPELGCLVKFIYETHGREAVRSLWQHGAA